MVCSSMREAHVSTTPMPIKYVMAPHVRWLEMDGRASVVVTKSAISSTDRYNVCEQLERLPAQACNHLNLDSSFIASASLAFLAIHRSTNS